jgi:hypothetical protein
MMRKVFAVCHGNTFLKRALAWGASGEAERTLAEAAYGENTGVLPQEVIDVAGESFNI